MLYNRSEQGSGLVEWFLLLAMFVITLIIIYTIIGGFTIASIDIDTLRQGFEIMGSIIQ